MKLYVGLATTAHDSAIALVGERGEVLFAQATERHLQSKRAFHAPPDQMDHVTKLLAAHGGASSEIVAATTWSMGPARTRLYELFEAWTTRRGFSHPHRELEWAFIRAVLLGTLGLGRTAGLNLDYARRALGGRGTLELRRYDHHLTHAAAACLSSPFEEAVCAILDGYGEAASTAMFRYQGGRLTRIPGAGHSAKASPGVFYARLCRACGFDPVLGEEWKVMGLAAYGERDEALYRVLRPMLRVEGLGLARDPRQHDAWAELDARRGGDPMAHADLAHTGQLVFSELCTELLRNLHALGLSKNLVLGGGCALNSSYNGRVLEETGFERLHVFSAPADDGNAVGAALLAHQQDHPPPRAPAKLMSPYLGEEVSSAALERFERFGPLRTSLPAGKTVERHTAELLAAGKIVGWVQGRAEMGPRALGNRSILADPRSPTIKDTINERVKFREEFRPFAPAILDEHGPAWFVRYQESPYMERTLRFEPAMGAKVPGVVHADGTGRLQSVKRDMNPRFHALIGAFHELTGVPILLNTSFNVMGKPIIHSVEDAVAVFFTTGLDVLVIGDSVFEKR